MAEYESILKFESYFVDEITFKRNNKFKLDITNPPRVEFNIKKSKIENGNNMIIRLFVHIFKDAENNNYPFEMKVSITGIFEVSDTSGKFDFEPNAIAILYPYVRSIVSNYTVNANIGAVVLPAINVNEMLRQEQENDKKD